MVRRLTVRKDWFRAKISLRKCIRPLVGDFMFSGPR
jgi:hypothetical protein